VFLNQLCRFYWFVVTPARVNRSAPTNDRDIRGNGYDRTCRLVTVATDLSWDRRIGCRRAWDVARCHALRLGDNARFHSQRALHQDEARSGPHDAELGSMADGGRVLHWRVRTCGRCRAARAVAAAGGRDRAHCVLHSGISRERESGTQRRGGRQQVGDSVVASGTDAGALHRTHVVVGGLEPRLTTPFGGVWASKTPNRTFRLVLRARARSGVRGMAAYNSLDASGGSVFFN
jgi:hypothetical protein